MIITTQPVQLSYWKLKEKISHSTRVDPGDTNNSHLKLSFLHFQEMAVELVQEF